MVARLQRRVVAVMLLDIVVRFVNIKIGKIIIMFVVSRHLVGTVKVLHPIHTQLLQDHLKIQADLIVLLLPLNSLLLPPHLTLLRHLVIT